MSSHASPHLDAHSLGVGTLVNHTIDALNNGRIHAQLLGQVVRGPGIQKYDVLNVVGGSGGMRRQPSYQHHDDVTECRVNVPQSFAHGYYSC